MNGLLMTTKRLAMLQREARALIESFKDKSWSNMQQYLLNDGIERLFEEYDVSHKYVCVGKIRDDGTVPIEGITADARVIIWAIFVAPLIEIPELNTTEL